MGNKNKKIESTATKETIVLDFSFPTSLISVKVDGFNNYLKDDDSAFKYVNYCLNELAEKLNTATQSDMYSTVSKHCHRIKEENKLKIIESAIKEAYLKSNESLTTKDAKAFYDQNFVESTFHQIGLKGGLRLIGVFERNHHFKVVLIDYYHTLFPNINYNEDDIDSYSVCFYGRGK